ncbi:MAG: tyrosinase family protein [Saprospiraceae bacterium]
MPSLKKLNLLLLLCFTVFTVSMLAAQSPKLRKNIEDLTPTELETYKNAIKTMKAKAWPDPGSYQYWANVHDSQNPAGGCLHENSLFLPWHRSYFYWFEKELQKIEPSITIPYWDFTVAPSKSDGGMKFPKAFEDPNSPLFPSKKIYNGYAVRPIATSPVPPLFNPSDVQETLHPTFEKFWHDFENNIHNLMHPWIGNPLFNPQTAAEDPLFWSFHAYIDLVWDKWQKGHNYEYACQSSDPTQNCDLNAYLFSDQGSFHTEDQVKGFVNIEQQLGYTYNNSSVPKSRSMALARVSGNEPVVNKMASFAKSAVVHPKEQTFKVAQKKVQATHVYALNTPDRGFWKARLNIKGLTQLGSHSVKGTVFVHPLNEINPKYLIKNGPASTFGIWKGHSQMGGHDDHSGQSGHALKIVDRALDISESLHEAMHKYPGKALAVSIILEAIPHFDGDVIPSGDAIKFKDVNIEYDVK